MKQVWKKVSAVLITVMLLWYSGTPAFAATQEQIQAREQAAQATAGLAAAYGMADSVQYALWDDGEIVLSGGMAISLRGRNQQITEDTLYGIGSVSKVYTAAAVMQLVEDGKIDLDQPVTTYLPEFRMKDERYREITVRMLLNHSSGLLGDTMVNEVLFDDPDEDDAMENFLKRLESQTLQANPGEYSVYCNDGFTLASLVVERVSGMSFREYIRKEITGPLGLEDTFAPGDNFDEERLADTYLTTAEDAEPTLPEVFVTPGTGGLYATAEDLAEFGGAFCGTSLLTETSLDAMENEEYLRGIWPDTEEGDMIAYGLGWDSVNLYPFSEDDISAMAKGGDTLVYHASLVVLPEYDMAAAVLTSGGTSSYNEAAAIQLLMDALEAEGKTIEVEAELLAAEPAQMPKELMELEGFYGSTVGGAYQVTVKENGTLEITTLTLADQEPVALQYYSDGSFRYEGQPMRVKLVKEENGKVYLYQENYVELPGLAPMHTAAYAAQLMPEQKTDEQAQAAWNAREGKIYLTLNEKYTSAMYPMSSVFQAVTLAVTPEGYVAYNRITDANTALPFLQIPGQGSRSSSQIDMETINGIEYMNANGWLMIDAAQTETLPTEGTKNYTIDLTGHARWFQVGQSAGKQINVEIMGEGAFYVYDAMFQMVASSRDGTSSVTLPQGGLIVFAGNAGTLFKTTIA